MASVNTNYSARVALQNLNVTNKEMETVQNRINTGLKVSSATDNGAVFAIAQSMRGKVGGYGVAMESIDRAISVVDVANTAAAAVSDLLNQMKEKATAAKDTSLSTAQRAAFNEDFVQLRDQIGRIVDNADFNGRSLIGEDSEDLTALMNDTGSSTMTITATSLALSGSTISVAGDASFSTATEAGDALSDVDDSIAALNTVLARFGSQANALEGHKKFLGKLSDTLEAGIGKLVDADLASESARLQSLQVKQQLGAQALSIANQSAGILLSFFR